MANLYSQFMYDDALELKASAAVGATATESVILDLGQGLVDGFVVLDVSDIEVASGNEKYTIHLEGSTVAGMASGSVTLANIPLGIATDPADATTATGRFAVPFRNEQNGTLYRYVRLYTLVAGTIGSGGITFSSFIAKR